jgi:AAA15 family ATPase/GTPase
MLPLALMGDGLGRFTSLMLKIANARHGIVLVDEIENGLYYTSMSKVWTAIAEAARLFDVQIFATTHSWECIRVAHQAFEADGRYDFRLHRLDRINDEIRAVAYDQEMLATAIATDLEVR